MADRDEDPRHRVADLDRQEEEDPRLEANDEENNLDNEEEDPDGQAAAVGDETMRLTEEERQWAFSIMAAIEDDPELDALSDFQIAQLALVDRDNVDAAVERAHKMQWFRQEYDVRDTFEDALVSVRDYMKLYKNLVLSFSYSKESQCYVSCTDLCAVKKLVSEDQWKVNLKGLFHIYQAMNPNIKSIRSGMVLVIECLRFSPSKAGGVNHFKRVGDELLNCYPAKHQAMKHYHSGIFSNVAVAIVKPFLPKELRDAIEVGCLYDGRLDSLFLVPDAETAQRRNYFRIMDTLKLRYDNERQFSVLWPALDAPQTQS